MTPAHIGRRRHHHGEKATHHCHTKSRRAGRRRAAGKSTGAKRVGARRSALTVNARRQYSRVEADIDRPKFLASVLKRLPSAQRRRGALPARMGLLCRRR